MKQISMLMATIVALTLAASVNAQPGEADVAAMRDYVEKNRAYSPPARAEASRLLARLPSLIGHPVRFDLEAAHIAALADNGHSMLLPPQWASRYPRSPIRFGLFADGLFVIAAPAENADTVGRPVTAINGRPWRAVQRAYSRYQGGVQAFRDQFVTLFMTTPALLTAAGLGSDPGHLTVTLEMPGGRRRTLTVAAQLSPYQGEEAFFGRPQLREAATLIAPAARPLYLREPDRLFRLVFLPELEGAYVQLNAVRGTGIRDFLGTALADLRARRPQNIIIDLRFNLGGDLNIARDFMQALPTIAQGGRLFAITSGRTFSAAISSLGYLRQAAGSRLTIVGEPVGDRLEFWAEGDTVELPGLGAVLLYATERHNYRTGCPEPDCHGSIRTHPIRVSSLQPNIAAPLRFAAFVQGRDPAMEAITREIRRSRTGQRLTRR